MTTHGANDCYYDWNNRLPVSTDAAEPFSQWMHETHPASRFALHPDGFFVFLPPDRLSDADEYLDGDPYRVSSNFETPFQRHRVQMTRALVRKGLGSATTPRILDVACGEGHLTAAIRQEFPQASISAFDTSLSAIRRACRTYPGIDFAVADACAPPYRPDYFDCVVCNNIWEHVPDPLLLLRNIRRSLRPQGCLIISTPSRYRLNNLLRVLTGRPVVLASSYHVTEYSVGQVCEQLRYGGFQVEAIEGRMTWPQTPGVKSAAQYAAGRLLETLARAFGSHHHLGQTAFYLARRQ